MLEMIFISFIFYVIVFIEKMDPDSPFFKKRVSNTKLRSHKTNGPNLALQLKNYSRKLSVTKSIYDFIPGIRSFRNV